MEQKKEGKDGIYATKKEARREERKRGRKERKEGRDDRGDYQYALTVS